MRRKNWKVNGLIAYVVFLLMMMIGTAPSFAQPFPNKPINLLVAVGTGGTADTSARMLAKSVSDILGQPMIVTNNGGGGGTVGIALLAKEKPDGYHLVFCSSQPLTIIPHLRQLPYNPDDIIPVMQMGMQQTGLAVRADAPWKILKELVDYAKKNPKKVTYTITGTYMNTHLAMMYVARQEGIDWTAIPVSGDPNMPLLGGHVTAMSAGSSWATHVREGRYRLLAVHGENRMKSFPDVPTFRELGYNFVGGLTTYILAPKGTPSTVLQTLESAFRKAMENPEFLQYQQKIEQELTALSSEVSRKYLEAEYKRYGELCEQFKVPKESESK